MVANGIDAPLKGLDVAVEAVRQARSEVSDMGLILLGSWIDPRRIERLPAFCDVRGPVSRQTVSEVLRGAGCCVLPSIWEEFGYVGLEALAAGTPLVCGDLPAFTQLASDGIVLARDRTPAGFTDAVCRAVEIGTFEFPPDCRASDAVPRITALYERLILGE